MDLNNLSFKTPKEEEEEEEEESGWTAYFEDFSNHNSSLSSSFCASSMVSDAASFPARKSFPSSNNYNNKNTNSSCVGGSPKFPRKLTFKATRAKEISLDDSLEDTASSPVNSPKVSDMDVIERRTNDHFNSSLGKGGNLEEYGAGERERKERNEMSSCSGTNGLKKRGLCLVPLSMLVNYLG